MIIIASAAYVDMEFRAEVGDLPPAMLPVGNKRLFEHQVDVLRDKFLDENIYLSLPEGYKLPKKDHLKILEYNIEVVVVPVDTSLADSILYVINSVGEYEGGVRLLHGDTLIYDLPSGIDVIAVSKTSDDYNWEIESIGLNEETVWSGFFSFRTPKLLIKSLTVSRGSFVDAIRLYNVHSQMDVIELFEWLDFGHINNYFKSRSKINTQRHFNEIKIDDGKVIKSSNNSVKISAERKWFRSVPPEIRYYTPQVIGQGNLISGDEYYEALSSVEGVNPLSKIGDIITLYRGSGISKCPLADGDISISEIGDVYPCQMLYEPEFKGGNIKENSIKEVWSNVNWKRIREIHASGQRNQINFCQDCRLFDEDFHMEDWKQKRLHAEQQPTQSNEHNLSFR